MRNNKKVKRSGGSYNKSVTIATEAAKSNQDEYLVWCFDKVDNDGCFRFSHEVMDTQEVLEKIIIYGKRKWKDIEKDTHDHTNKRKHHNLMRLNAAQHRRDSVSFHKYRLESAM